VKDRWWVDPGTSCLELAPSSTEVFSSVDFALGGEVDQPEPLALEYAVGDWFAHPVVGPALMQAMMADATEEQLAAASENENMLPMGQLARLPGVEIPDAALERLRAGIEGRDARESLPRMQRPCDQVVWRRTSETGKMIPSGPGASVAPTEGAGQRRVIRSRGRMAIRRPCSLVSCRTVDRGGVDAAARAMSS
jgi:hypothetical protein